MKPEAPVPLTSQGHRAGGNEHRHLASNSMTMFGSNAWDRATQHPTDLVGDNLHQGGATRHWVSPYSDPQLEYVYLGTPHQGSPQTSQVASPQRWPMPDATLNPSLAPPASNNVQYFQPTSGHPTSGQPTSGHAYIDHNGYNAAPTGTAQPSYTMPSSHFQLSQFQTVQRFGGVLSQETYEGPAVSELQYDNIWSISESNFLAQRSPQFNVAPGDIDMVEGYGLNSSANMQTPMASQLQQGGSVGNSTGNWTMLSQSPVLDDVGSSSSGQGAYNSTITGQTSMGGDNQGFLHDHHHSEGSRDCDRALFQLGGMPLPNVGYGETVMNPRLDYMNIVMEDTVSDGVSSTSTVDNRSSRDARAQTPYGHDQSGQGSSPLDSSVREQFQHNHQQRLEHREAYNTSARSDYNGQATATDNDFTQLIASGFSGIRHLGEPRWAMQLLNLCAAAIASRNISRTQHLMWVLNDLASVVGDANQRFAAYGLRALFCRITGRMEAASTFLRPRHYDQEISFGPKTVHRALVKFHEYVPWHQICYTAACQILMEVCAGKARLHLIDIGAGKGIEWPIFIDALVSRPGGPPAILKITMIRDQRREELNMRTAKSVNSEAADLMTRLVKFAGLVGLHVEVNVVTKALECVTREDLKIRDGETLAAVCQFRIHRLSEEVPDRATKSNPTSRPLLSPRDDFFDFLFSLKPDVFIMSDNDSDHCSHDFLTRFQNAISFWWRCYESMDIGYNGRDSEERQIIEYEGGMMVLNMVACEGFARIERNESYPQWQRRITRAGFVPQNLSDETKKVCQTLISNHSEFWELSFTDSNVVNLLWRKQPTTFTSVWKMPQSYSSSSSCQSTLIHN